MGELWIKFTLFLWNGAQIMFDRVKNSRKRCNLNGLQLGTVYVSHAVNIANHHFFSDSPTTNIVQPQPFKGQF